MGLAEKLNGKTSMFGKTYNTIGSTDSNFIIKTKGDLKVQWGNKYIDVIKNGKIASEGSKLLFIIDNPDEIKLNGLYLINSTEGAEVWLNIDGTKVNLGGGENGTTYVSYMTELLLTSDLLHLAMSNIGFYYKDIDSAKLAHILSGIIYVENENKLYIAKDGSLTEYTILQKVVLGNTEATQEETHPLYIAEYSLWVNKVEYIRCSSNAIYLLLQVFVYDTLLSDGANETTGYRLYMDKGYSVLEIDYIKWRKYPIPIKHAELLKKIEYKELNPKMYYNITDFLNPWLVTWSEEPFLYNDTYEKINEVDHLSGVENALELIVKAKSREELEEQAWSIKYPDWIIHYDVHFLGPEHIIDENTKYYGYRSKVDIVSSATSYLPCKGQITYLRDEFGNEGNFNFRQFRFKRNGVWRYCIDDTTDPNNLLGNFCKKAKNNTFILESIDSYVLVFTFESVTNSTNDIIGYNIIPVEDDMLLTIGHNLIVLSEESNNNTFNLPEAEELRVHEIKGLLENNKFINIEKTIQCYVDIKNNTFENLKKSLDILIPCEDNTLIDFEEDVIIQGTKFDKNYLSKFKYNINNYDIFEGNKIYQCDGYITNNNTMSNNTILYCKGNINNSGIIDLNNITLCIGDITNQGNIISNEILQLAIELYVDSGDFQENLCLNIETLRSLGSFIGNTLDNVISLYNQSIFSENIITTINDLNNQGNISNNSIKNITYLYNQNEFTNNTISDIRNLSNQGTLTNNTVTYIENLDNSGTFSENIIESIIGYLHNNNNITNNNINTIDSLNISADMSNNTITKIVNSYINGNFIENIFNIITDSTFNGTCLLNDSKKTFSNSLVNDFINNIIYLNINSLAPNGSITNCIFKYDILNFYPNNLINCLLEFINNLSLDRDAVHTTFHGSIGNPDRLLTEHEWDLLGDGGKKTDAYPNIRVVCVPEIIKKGMILMWYGKEAIPKGWALCDGKNGTPNLVGSFIKGDSSTASEPTVPEGVDEETNEYTLKTEHLPKHSHPHKAHHHYFEDSDSDSIYDDYATEGGSYSVNEGEGSSTTSGKGVDTDWETETISISISGNTSDVTSEEDGWQYNDPPTPIKLEPKHFKIIFIMKIDENPE